jgi:hypothetical protein
MKPFQGTMLYETIAGAIGHYRKPLQRPMSYETAPSAHGLGIYSVRRPTVQETIPGPPSHRKAFQGTLL